MVTHGYYVRETAVRKQIVEVLRRFDLMRMVKPFVRCMRCNAVLAPARKEEVAERVPPEAAGLHEEFLLCPGCGRVYWRGGHYRRMRAFLEGMG